MCGRYALYGPSSRLKEHFGTDDWPEWTDRYNMAPSLDVPVVRVAPDGRRVAHLLRWGLVPHWAKDTAIGARLNNARAETVADKPSFRSAFARRRCLIPACGYFEWQTVPGERKQPWYISLRGADGRDSVPMAMGGLWESWTDPDGTVLRTCCVITTGPNDLMAPIHDRMPVIVEPADWARWLGGKTNAGGDVGDLLTPFDAARMQAWPVSRAVSNARNEGPALIVAAGDEAPQNAE